MDISGLKKTLKKSWSKETSFDPKNWTPENPAWGQCLITALIVQDFFGGKILEGKVKIPGRTKCCAHYWNEPSDGQETDLTKEQFPDGASLEGAIRTRTRAYCLRTQTVKRRYLLLKSVIDELISRQSESGENK